MPRHDGSGGVYHSTRSSGHSRRSAGRGTYSKQRKGREAQRLPRIYLEGTYSSFDMVRRSGGKTRVNHDMFRKQDDD